MFTSTTSRNYPENIDEDTDTDAADSDRDSSDKVGINKGNEGEPHIELADERTRWPQFGNLWIQQPTMLMELKMTS